MRLALALAFLCALPLPAAGTREQVPANGFSRGLNDFLPLYVGGRLAGTPDLYSRDRMLSLERELTGSWSGSLLYVRPPYHALLMKPFALLPYRTAYILFQALSLAAMLAFLFVWRENSRGLLLAACVVSVPLFAAFRNGQDASFLLLLFALFVRWRDSHPALAGVALALCGFKFHLFFLVPVLMLSQRRWRMVAAFAGAAAVLAAVSFALAGPRWPWEFLQLLANDRDHPEFMPNWRAVWGGGPALYAASALTVAAALAVIVKRDFHLGLAAALAAAVLAGRHVNVHDCVLLVPSLVVLVERAGALPVRLLAALLLTPVPYILRLLDTPLNVVPQAALAGLLAALLLSRAATRPLPPPGARPLAASAGTGTPVPPPALGA